MISLLFGLAVAVAVTLRAVPAPAPPIVRVPARAAMAQLQAIVDAAPRGATVIIPSGVYDGHLVISKPVHLIGQGRPRLVGTANESVMRIVAPGVTVEGFDIDGRGLGDLGRDTAGIHVSAPHASIRNCYIRGTLFGIYLRAADDATVEGCTIRGIPGKDPGEKGSGIHIWNTRRFHVFGNDIRDVRDGFYIQSSSHGLITDNVARDLRYGLHYMFSDDNVFERNTFANGAAGTALMYSDRIVFRHNSFVHNRGFASVGLLLKNCDDVIAEENLIADNARGIFLEGSNRNVFERNVIADSDVAIVLYDSCADNRFAGNSFIANMTPLSLVGRRTDTEFDGNYWSDNDEPDLDGDGRSDRPYRLSSVFDHFRGNVAAADLFATGPAALAIGAAEATFPVLEAISAEDHAPLARAPRLEGVPSVTPSSGGSALPGLAVSFTLFSVASLVLLRGGARVSRRVGR